MPYKIGPRVALRHYIAEHLEARTPSLTQRELADRLDCDEMTVSRWINYKVKVTPDILAAIAEALGGDLMEWTDLLHHPDRPSADQLLRQLPEDEQKFYMKQLKTAAKGTR
jgi:plasmid maintenance system antidote protein VapI